MQLFDDVVAATDEGEKSPIRALQVWQYLIAQAKNRRIIRYEELADMMGYGGSTGVKHALACIMWYCEQQEPPLPPLTLIVVNKATGEPGMGFTAALRQDYHRTRERVFDHEWYRIVPPTVDEFRRARTVALATQPAEAALV